MKKKYIVMLGGVLLLAGAGLGLLFGSIDMNQISRMLEDIPHGLREILMIVLIAAQIFLAFLPGEPLELAAGFLFGSVGGTLLCLVGSLLGTALVYLLVQRYGKRLVTVFFKQEQLNEFTGVLKKRNSMLWIFLLFLIPGTPKDIMTYVVSLSNIALGKWLLLTTVGRIPSIVTSTFLSGSLKEGISSQLPEWQYLRFCL
ncbi:MAG: TVP38/TMEM64 family protein [[Clostridium] innocuum]